MYLHDTIVAPATPPGAGAVAIVRLSGDRAIEIARSLWHPIAGARKPTPRRLCLGDISDPVTGAALDRAMCVMIPGPRSLTGEDVAELHCHGGPYLVRRVLMLAVAMGARMAEPGEFTRRAFLNGRIDLTEAEAVADLVAARGEAGLRNALAQLSGALGERVGRLREAVTAVRAHLEAEIDFSDQDIPVLSREAIAADLDRLVSEIRILHDSFARGRMMREGARAAIVGKPNAGKSSVLNLLLGVERAIVTPIPGTTRDIIEDAIALGAWPLVLQDTAGLRDPEDEVERIGVERTHERAAAADLLLAVFDSSRPFESEDLHVVEILGRRPGVAILNKCDLPARLGPDDLRARGVGVPIVRLSALRGDGAQALRDELARCVEALAGEGSGAGEQPAISRERHRVALARALEMLAAARAGAMAGAPPEIVAIDVTAAAEALEAITGAISTEDVLDAVFREFCIGK